MSKNGVFWTSYLDWQFLLTQKRYFYVFYAIFACYEKTRKMTLFKNVFLSVCTSLGFVRLFTFHDFWHFLCIFYTFLKCHFLQAHNQKRVFLVIFDCFLTFFHSFFHWDGCTLGKCQKRHVIFRGSISRFVPDFSLLTLFDTFCNIFCEILWNSPIDVFVSFP